MEETCELMVSDNGRALFNVKAARITGFSSQIAEEALAVEESVSVRRSFNYPQVEHQ